MNKIYVSTKTKIAAWIMTVIGGIGGIGGLLVASLGLRRNDDIGYMLFFYMGAPIFVFSLLYFLSGVILFTKRKVAWIVSAGILCIEMLFPLYITIYEFRWCLIRGWFGASDLLYWSIPLLFLLLFPLVLFLLDRKNYWEIAS